LDLSCLRLGSMDEKRVLHPPLYLLALTLAQRASDEIAKLRSALWQAHGDVSHLLLPPLIPLLWSKTPLAPFETILLPKMPPQVSFEKLTEVGKSLYLTSEEEAWQVAATALVQAYTHSKVEEAPFPAYRGIYLGNRVPLEREVKILNDDWRLLYFQTEWHSLKDDVIHLYWQILTNRHLIAST